MRRIHKRGALELSINAIVIVILAMTLLGLGLGFVRNMFQDIGKTTTSVQDQVREQILEDLRTGDKKLSFPSSRLDVEKGQQEILAIGVKNVNPSDLNFQIKLVEISKDVNDVTQEVTINSDPNLDTRVNKYAYLWDDTTQSLSPGEPNVYPITLDTDRTATGTKLFKIIIIEMVTDPLDPNVIIEEEYISKSFFVRFI